MKGNAAQPVSRSTTKEPLIGRPGCREQGDRLHHIIKHAESPRHPQGFAESVSAPYSVAFLALQGPHKVNETLLRECSLQQLNSPTVVDMCLPLPGGLATSSRLERVPFRSHHKRLMQELRDLHHLHSSRLWKTIVCSYRVGSRVNPTFLFFSVSTFILIFAHFSTSR